MQLSSSPSVAVVFRGGVPDQWRAGDGPARGHHARIAGRRSTGLDDHVHVECGARRDLVSVLGGLIIGRRARAVVHHAAGRLPLRNRDVLREPYPGDCSGRLQLVHPGVEPGRPRAVELREERVQIKELTPTWSRKLPNNRRFTLVLDGLAGIRQRDRFDLRRRTPSENTQTWAWGAYNCMDRTIAARPGWRLPSVAELQTLFDQCGSATAILFGPPFPSSALSRETAGGSRPLLPPPSTR